MARPNSGVSIDIFEFLDGKRPMIEPGTRVRSRQRPELTGLMDRWEYHESGRVSGIPYHVIWDDSTEACRLLGWLFVYASDAGIEANGG